MKNKLFLIIGTMIALSITYIVGTKLYQNEMNAQQSSVVESDGDILDRPYAPRMGRKGAPVQVVEFLDPECESCRLFYPYVKMLLNEYEGKIELIIRYAPFHGNSKFVIQILEAARKQNRYWETLELLFQHQPEWGSHHNPRPDLIWNYLTQLDLNIDRIRKDKNDPKILEMIDEEMKDVEKLGIKATPTFFINGKILTTFSYDGLKSAIESALKN